MRQTIVFIIMLLLSGAAFGQENVKTKEFSDYMEMRRYFGGLYQQKKFKEAADVLEKHLDRFPDNIEANAINLAIVYTQLKQYEDGIKALKYGHDHGIWFNIYSFRMELWAPYKELEAFQKITERNEEMRQEAQKSARPDLLVVTPEGYDPDKNYPLFIALHGGSSNIENFKGRWKSDLLEKEFIVAYVQSSLLVSMDTYAWTVDLEISSKELVEAYNKIKEEYAVNEEEIIIGGFSAGSMAGLEIALNNLIPVSGFIALCPGKLDSFTEENIINMKNRGIRGSIITSEMDHNLSVQKEMVEVLKKLGFQYQFILTPNIGHWFPEDLDKKIDGSIKHIRNK